MFLYLFALKPICFFLATCITFSVHAQYYLKGIVQNEWKQPLPYVKILLSSKGTISFTTGSSGLFGIPTAQNIDTITLIAEGYDTLRQVGNSNQFITLTMKASAGNSFEHALISLTKNYLPYQKKQIYYNESYTSRVENDFINAKQFSETGFSLHIHSASYSNVRRFLNNNTTVPPDAVRIEEMVNYFNIENNPLPCDSFSFHTTLTPAPWNAAHQLLFLEVAAPTLNITTQTLPCNFVFLVDVSGSMDSDNRLLLVKYGLKQLIQNLRIEDTIAIVTYGGGVVIHLPPTSGKEKLRIMNAIEQLEAGGDTPGGAALQTAYHLLKTHFHAAANNRVILATDGDFNVGETTEAELTNIIRPYKNDGIYLTCIGVGKINYKDSRLEALAKEGNGNFAYIDNTQEAEKVFVSEFANSFNTVAQNAYVTLSFQPDYIKRYRLIGFDNSIQTVLKGSEYLLGGEIGSGRHILALFEIEPELTYNTYKNIATGILHYQSANATNTFTIPFTVSPLLVPFDSLKAQWRMATAVSMFGMLLKHSKYATYGWNAVQKIAESALDKNNYLQQEFISLLIKAKKIYSKEK